MATVPSTTDFVSGIATSTELNAYVSDPLDFLLRRPIFRGRQTVTQNLTTATWTALTIDTEDVDSDVGGGGAHDTSSNTSRFTARYPGWYQVSGASSFPGNVTGRRGSRLGVNGTALNGSTVIVTATTASGVIIPTAAELLYLNVSDYVEVFAFQDSGGTLATVVATDAQSRLNVIWVSN